MEKYFKLLGLTVDASIKDVKKAYRTLAKKNHPDLFPDEMEKKKQENVMASLNEALLILEKFFKQQNPYIKPPVAQKNSFKNTEKDTSLYKKGVEYFNRYSGSISLKSPQYTRFDRETIEEKASWLIKAQSCFNQLVKDFPESDWVYDAEERLKKIEKIMKNLLKK